MFSKTTLGIPILVVLLRVLTFAFSLTVLGNPPESIQSGNYGQPPKTRWWLKQSFIYFIGLLGMKLCVFLIFQLCPWIIRIGDWALRWTEGNEMVQVFFVMLFFPVVMNAIQYYIIDSFIKDQKPSDHEPPHNEENTSDNGDGDGPVGRTEWISEDLVSRDQEGKAVVKDGIKVHVHENKGTPGSNRHTQGRAEYDPEIDGESSEIIKEGDLPRPVLGNRPVENGAA